MHTSNSSADPARKQSGGRRATVFGLTVLLMFAAGLVAAGCGQANGGADAPDGTTETTLAWSLDSDCAVCHAAYGTDASGPLAASHLTQGADCLSCHADTAGLQNAHAGLTADAPAPTELKQTEVTAEACTSCHNEAELAAATAAAPVLTDLNGTVVNPHALPANEGHVNIACANCHTMHDAEADLAVDAMGVCTGCHHAQVFECGTCH